MQYPLRYFYLILCQFESGLLTDEAIYLASCGVFDLMTFFARSSLNCSTRSIDMHAQK